MKKLQIFAFLCLASSPLFAQEAAVKIIDVDAKGTNLRANPQGEVIKVIARNDDASRLSIKVNGAENGWFSVSLQDGTQGWLHHSVLGTCASATEDGAPVLKQEPYEKAKSIKVKNNQPLYLENAPPVQADNTTWLKVSWLVEGKKRTAWARTEVTYAGINCGHGKHPHYRK